MRNLLARVIETASIVVGVACVIAAPNIAAASATNIPEFRLGSCGGAGCVWPCDTAPQDVSDLKCPCDTGNPGVEHCAQGATCSLGTCPSCVMSPSDVFTGRLVMEVDDEACGAGEGGSKVTVAFRGRTQGGQEFTVASKVIDFCNVNSGCNEFCDLFCGDQCAPGSCTGCDPDTCGIGSSCAPTATFLCEFQGAYESCGVVPSGRRFCEADLAAEDSGVLVVESWLEQGNQPLLQVIGQELLQSGGLFENASGTPVVASVSGAVIDDNSLELGPTTASYCVKMWILSEFRYPPVPSGVAFALSGMQACTAPGCTLTVPELGNCEDFLPCGDGVVDPNEQCDGANAAGCEFGCLSSCQCSPTFQCPATPSSSCVTGAKSSLKIRRGTDPTKDQLKWKVQQAGSVMQPDLGSPMTATSYALCIYDESGGTPELAGSLVLPPSMLWDDKAPKGYTYKDAAAAQAGVRNVQLKTGEATKSKAQLGARGSTATWPSPLDATTFFDQDTTVRAQLFNSSNSTCWSAAFTTPKKNDGERYEARAP